MDAEDDALIEDVRSMGFEREVGVGEGGTWRKVTSGASVWVDPRVSYNSARFF